MIPALPPETTSLLKQKEKPSRKRMLSPYRYFSATAIQHHPRGTLPLPWK
jgi:hypothetical protein